MVMGAGFGVVYLLGIAAIWVLVAMVLFQSYRVLSLKHKMMLREDQSARATTARIADER